MVDIIVQAVIHMNIRLTFFKKKSDVFQTLYWSLETQCKAQDRQASALET